MVQTKDIYRGIAFPFRKGLNQFPEEVTDDLLIKETLVQLLLTSRNERVMRSGVGSNILGYVFEDNNEVLAAMIRTDVSAIVDRYEPRVSINEVQVARSDEAVIVTVLYTVISLRISDFVDLVLPST